MSRRNNAGASTEAWRILALPDINQIDSNTTTKSSKDLYSRSLAANLFLSKSILPVDDSCFTSPSTQGLSDW